MTVGPLPPHPDLINVVAGGPMVVPLLPPGDDAFAVAMRTMTGNGGAAERFNENGFFSNTDAVATPGQAVTAPPAALPAAGEVLPPAIVPLSAADLLAAHADIPEPAAASATALCNQQVGSVGTGAAPPAVSRSATPSTTNAEPVAIPTARPFPRAPVYQPAAPARAGAIRSASSDASRSPIGVTFGARDGAAAIAVAAPGLTDLEAEALHADIVALLRRHGLTLDDLRLNGRSMRGGQHQPGN